MDELNEHPPMENNMKKMMMVHLNMIQVMKAVPRHTPKVEL